MSERLKWMLRMPGRMLRKPEWMLRAPERPREIDGFGT